MPEARPSTRLGLYASLGPELTHYDVDVAGGALLRRATVRLPANLHYAWPHRSRRVLYAACSNTAPGGVAGDGGHCLAALSIDPASGALAPHGAPVALPARPIHMTTDIPSENILVAFSNPSGLRVYRVEADATLGGEVAQQPLDPGIYAHQVRVRADNRKVILVARGHDAEAGRPEEPGALKVFDYAAGRLAGEVSVAPEGGFGFGPRHLDFHPTRPWVYVSLERQNRLDMFVFEGDRLSPAAAFRKTTLQRPAARPPARQAAGTVHLHPSGNFVYVANRASATVEVEGRRVFAGGENSFAVYRIDPRTGEPEPIQHIDTEGVHCRTFHIDPSGRLLVAAHIMPLTVRDGGGFTTVPASLALFRIGDDGRLAFLRKYDVEVGDRTMFWMGMVDR